MASHTRHASGGDAAMMLVALILFFGMGGSCMAAVDTHITMQQRLSVKFKVHFTQTPVRKAFAVMAQALHLNVVFDASSVAAVGTQPTTTISLHIRHAESARWILDQMTHNVSSGPLDWTVAHDSLLVGSHDWITLHKELRIYNVAPLVLKRLQTHIWYVSRTRLIKLSRLIENTVDQDGWIANGGTVGRLTIFRSCLIIVNTRRNQWAVEKILADLERAAADGAQKSTHLWKRPE